MAGNWVLERLSGSLRARAEVVMGGRGMHLADVPGEFEGIPWTLWEQLASAERAESCREELRARGVEPEIMRRAVATGRDEYGMRGVRGRR